MSKLKIGIVGMGGIAMGAHVKGLKKCENAQIVAICDIDVEKLAKAGETLGISAENRFTDYREMLAKADIDAVEVCTPNHMHAPIAVDALHAGKAVNVEKPIALDYAQAQSILAAQNEMKLPGMMCFSYRFMPATRYAKSLIESGKLGRVLSLNVQYLKDSALWPGRKLEWRFVKEYAGTGVLGDLGAHLVDMARFLVGDFTAVCGMANTVITERPRLDGKGMGRVETDDECLFLAKLENGAKGSFMISRCAPGHANTIVFDIFGTDGTLSFNLNDPSVLGIGGAGLSPNDPKIHFVDVPAEYSSSQEAVFVSAALGQVDKYLPTIEDGVHCQRILDALLKSSEENRWISLRG